MNFWAILMQIAPTCDGDFASSSSGSSSSSSEAKGESRTLHCRRRRAAPLPPPLQYAVNRAQLPRGQHPTCRTQLRLVTASQRRRRHLWRRYHTRSAATARALCTTKQALLMQAVVSSCPRDFQMTRLCV